MINPGRTFCLAILAALTVTSANGAEDASGWGQHTPQMPRLLAVPVAPFAATEIDLSADEIDRLRRASFGVPFELPSVTLSLAANKSETFLFRRVNPYAQGAQIRALGKKGVQILNSTGRLHFLASGNTTAVALSLNPTNDEISGFVNRGRLSAELTGTLGGPIDIQLVQDAKSDIENTNQCGTRVGDQPHDPLALIKSGIPLSLSVGGPTGGVPVYQTEIAVDTDNEWMSNKFGNNTANATAFIEDMFMFMNVFYERDVALSLLISDMTLRTTTDPYTETDPNRFLDEFGAYWLFNQGAVQRDFAMLFSGRSINSGSFSGVAWIDVYCEEGFQFNSGGFLRTAGSYSVNRIGTNRTAANTAQFVGHELGHNMGSPHTHCYNPVLDNCYNLDSGCFAGAVSCPQPQGNGTIMSYCHFSTGNGGANCGTNREEFHPEVVNLFNNNIMNNFPACISSFVSGNLPPVALADNYVMDEDTSVFIGAPGVLANDSDPEADPLTAIQDGALTGLTLNANGSFSYSPPANFNGTVTFNYHANDGPNDSPTTTVTIRVLDVVEPPDYLFRNSYEGDTPP